MVSGRDILEALNGVRRDLGYFSGRLESVERTLTTVNTRGGQMKAELELIGRRVGAMRTESTASLSRIEAATRALSKTADEAAGKIVKEAETLRQTGEHLVPTQEELGRFEITARGVKLSARWSQIVGAVKAVPLAVKILGALAAGAGVAWAVLAHLAHKL